MQAAYPRYEKRKSLFKDLLNKYQELEGGLLGRSILGRDIDYFKIGKGNQSIIAVGAHHGMEYITSLALFDFVDFLEEKITRYGAHNGIDVRFLLQKFTFWIIPCLNPDGVELCISGISKNPLSERQLKMNGGADFSEWQANGRGVDLNHNYDYRFFEYKGYEAEKGIIAGKALFSGEYPESEPETHSLANLIRTLSPCLVVSLHTQGREIYSMPRCERIDRISQKIASSIGYKHSLTEGSAMFGGLCDYTGGILGIPSFTVELGKGKNPLPLSELDSVCAALRSLLILLPTYL